MGRQKDHSAKGCTSFSLRFTPALQSFRHFRRWKIECIADVFVQTVQVSRTVREPRIIFRKIEIL